MSTEAPMDELIGRLRYASNGDARDYRPGGTERTIDTLTSLACEAADALDQLRKEHEEALRYIKYLEDRVNALETLTAGRAMSTEAKAPERIYLDRDAVMLVRPTTRTHADEIEWVRTDLYEAAIEALERCERRLRFLEETGDELDTPETRAAREIVRLARGG